MKRIAIEAFSADEVSGIGTYSRNLIKNLAVIGSKIDDCHFFILVKKSLKINYPNNFSEVVFNVPHRMFIPVLLNFFIPFFVLIKRVDLLHCTKGISSVFKFCKTVSTIHDLIPIKHPESNKNIFYFIYWKFNLWFSVFSSNFLIANSLFTKNSIIDYYKLNDCNNKIDYTYLGCDQSVYKIRSDNECLAISRKLKLPQNFILFVGNLRDSKNVYASLKVLELLGNYKEMALVIVGAKKWVNKKFDKNFKDYSKKDRVVFTGRISDHELSCVYNLASVFIFPSLYEGFGLPIVEAQSCGCPCISSNRDSLPEVINSSELICDPDNYQCFYNKTKMIIDNESFRKKIINDGLNNIKMFSWEDMAKKTLTIYEEILR